MSKERKTLIVPATNPDQLFRLLRRQRVRVTAVSPPQRPTFSEDGRITNPHLLGNATVEIEGAPSVLKKATTAVTDMLTRRRR